MLSRQRKMSLAVLTSWKEVAAYLGKGVRTVQRWERHDGLPIRRITGTTKIVVRRDELDHWLEALPIHNGGSSRTPSTHVEEMRGGIQVAKDLRQKNAVLCHSFHGVMSRLVDERRRMSKVCELPHPRN